MKHYGFGQFILIILISLAAQQTAYAQTQYVTDSIMLGVHQDADANSTLLTSIPSAPK